MRFVHAADVHLDSPLHGLEAYEGAPVGAIRAAARQAFIKLIDLVLAEQVAFLILAGDLYDGDWPDFSTGLFAVQQLSRLHHAGVRVFLSAGNHDAQPRITKRLTYSSNVHVFPDDRPETIRLDSEGVAVHGQSYGSQDEKRNLAAGFPQAIPGLFNVGVLHTALEGHADHAPYAPCSVAELVGKGYDYWALGHIHLRRSVNGDSPPRIEFPGNLQGRHVREFGAKGCLLVDVNAAGRTTVEFRAVDVFRWEVLTVAVDGLGGIGEVVAAVADQFGEALDRGEERPLAVRAVLSGSTPLCDELMRNLEHLTNEIRARAVNECHGRLWVEKVKCNVTRPANPDPRPGDDAMSQLRDALAELRATHTAALSEGEAADLWSKLPELRDEILNNPETIEELFARAEALLTGPGGGT